MVKRVGGSGGMMTPRGTVAANRSAPAAANNGAVPAEGAAAAVVSTPRRVSLLIGSFTSRLGGILAREGGTRKESAAHPSILGKMA